MIFKHCVEIQCEKNYENFFFSFSDTKNGEIQSLVMYEYSDWPDHSVPGNVETLIRLIQSVQKSHSSKMVVHSSTGVGRTGTFFALHKLMQLVDANVVGLDIFQTVLGLRRQRKFMVKQLQQVIKIYFETLKLKLKLIFPLTVSILVLGCGSLHQGFLPKFETIQIASSLF